MHKRNRIWGMNSDFSMWMVRSACLSSRQVRDNTRFFLLAKIPQFFFFSLSLGIHIYTTMFVVVYSSHGCYYHFWHFFIPGIHVYNHVIVSLIILATYFFLSLLARVYVCHWHSQLCNLNGQQFVVIIIIIIFLFLLLLLFLQTNIYIYTSSIIEQ